MDFGAIVGDSTRRRTLKALGALAIAATAAGCGRRADDDPRTLVFRHPKLFGNPQAFDALVAGFERANGLRVRREALPASSDEQHLFYAINFQARSRAFDVLAIDTIWTAEFAAAGWLRDLTSLVTREDRGDLFPGPLASVEWHEATFALPWFIDAGVLYHRADLLERHRLEVPRTWQDLAEAAEAVTRAEPRHHGFVWQGKQHEGLVCNALEYVWSHGGDLDRDRIDAAARGLATMRGLVTRGVTPAFVTTLTEEPSRVMFGRGDAVFLRNWPYAFHLFEREGSPLRGRVGVSVLPAARGHAPAATLGGWQLGVNAFSPRAEAAERFVAFLAGAAAQKALALAYCYSPPRRSLYADDDLAAARPFTGRLRAIFEAARPRPVAPSYVGWSQMLQWQFSAVLTGERSARAALEAILEAGIDAR